MIDLEKLKPILEQLNPDASVLESILSIDEEVVSDGPEIERLNGEIAKINEDWNTRFKNAFFGSTAADGNHDEAVTEQVNKQSDEESNPKTFEDLFKEE